MNSTSKNISEIILMKVDNVKCNHPELTTITSKIVKKYYDKSKFIIYNHDPNSLPFLLPAFGNIYIEKMMEDVNNLPSFLPYMFNVVLLDEKYKEYIEYLIPILMNNIPIISTVKTFKSIKDNSFISMSLLIDNQTFGFIHSYNNTYFSLMKDIPYTYPFTNHMDFIYLQYEILKELKELNKLNEPSSDIDIVNHLEEIKRYTIKFEEKYIIRCYIKNNYAYIYDPNDIILMILQIKNMPKDVEVESTYWMDTLSYGFKYVVYPEEIEIDMNNDQCKIISNVNMEGRIIYNNITNREYMSPNMLVPTSIPGIFKLICKYTKRSETL